MTAWDEMKPVQFDYALMRGRKAREFVATSAATLFPDWLPPEARKTTPAAAQLPGQAAMFAEEDE